MPGLGTPSKPDLRFQSATITQLFVLAKHVPIHCQSVIPSTEGRRWLSCWSHHLLPIGSRISPLQTLPQQLLLLQKAKCSESQVKPNKQKKWIVLKYSVESGGAAPAGICTQSSVSSKKSLGFGAVGCTQGVLCAVAPPAPSGLCVSRGTAAAPGAGTVRGEEKQPASSRCQICPTSHQLGCSELQRSVQRAANCILMTI